AAARPWRVRWNETTRSARGGEAVRAWEGYLSVEVHPPTSTAGIERNPLGTFVTEISWTPLAGQLLDESAAGASAVSDPDGLASGAPASDGPAAPDSVAL
ncbi:MAG: type IV secretion system protein, partial [Bacteroidota bacterium]